MRGLGLRRWVVIDPEANGGSIFACSFDCAKEWCATFGFRLGQCQGNDGVDEMTVCDSGCSW